jgi:hypothetical protein
MLLFTLMMLFVQQPPFTVPGMTVTAPSDRDFGACIRPLSLDGSASSDLTVACTVRNGRPDDCRLETGADLPVRQRTAARCLAREYRFTDTATGAPANGAVTIPISLRVQVR